MQRREEKLIRIALAKHIEAGQVELDILQKSENKSIDWSETWTNPEAIILVATFAQNW